ncbi:unnamed protein product [Anisakis simplex]|uniref:WW domain-binding protein 4 (inferred by orthology to a human protein) n=1 Tax=Anisakis simplex TaxID=6269 RepID=A0A0M3JRQ6_ANISI|nr:unnamed protein product [Anisakis simplex]
MTDVWKSNARKFCEICKVWFADNRVSIEHHESGRRHKDAIQAKLRELGRQRSLKEKQQNDLQRTLAAMESAAKKSMSSDSTDLPCKWNQSERSVGFELVLCLFQGAPVGPALKPRTFMDPRAHGSSVAAMAVEMARRKREKEEVANLATKSQHWKDEDEDEQVLLPKKEPSIEKTEHNEEIVWAETTTDEGVPYYFQIYTGGSS